MIKNNNPKISIIIVNCNGKKYIQNCLDSILRSSFFDYEIIVVDNGSLDGSCEFIQDRYPNVKLIRSKKNLGFTGGNNQGIKQAQGDILFLLNNDTIIHRNLLKTLVQEIESSSDIGIVGPKIYYMPDKNKLDKIWFAGGKIDWSKGKTFHLGKNLTDKEIINDFKKEVDFITGCALMIKKEVIEKIGLLDNTFFAYYEDADWCQKTIKTGYKVVYIPFGGVWHIKSATASRVFLDDLKYQLQKDRKAKKIEIYFNMACRYLVNVINLKYRNYRNRFVFFMRYAIFRYKIVILFQFIFISTPKFIWAVIYQTPRSLLRIVWKHKNEFKNITT